MSKKKTFIGRLIQKIGSWFVSLTKAAEKVWLNLEPDLQNAMKTASGIVYEINKGVAETPEFVFELLLKKYPELSKEKLQEILNEIQKDIQVGQVIIQPDPLTTLANIQTALSSVTGSKWAKKSEEIANGIALILAPAKTPWNKIGTIMWWVYQTFIKKD